MRGQASAEYAMVLGALAGVCAAVWRLAGAWLPAMREGALAAARTAGDYF